jgi:hypothetical protein
MDGTMVLKAISIKVKFSEEKKSVFYEDGCILGCSTV